jgi:hypothetical protein
MQTTYTGTMLVVGALTTKPMMSRAGECDTYTLLGAGIFNAFLLDASVFLRRASSHYLQFPSSSSSSTQHHILES